MKNAQPAKTERAFTVMELLLVVAVVALLAALLLPALNRGRDSGLPRIHCIGNLKQIGLALRIWSDDNGGRFPMQSLTNGSGGLEFADATNGYRYFQAMSNVLSSPQVLVCPLDSSRSAATNFGSGFNNANVSYFIGLDADELRPQMILAGDRNITSGAAPNNGVLVLTNVAATGWTRQLHKVNGHVLLTDGTVVEWNSAELRNGIAKSGTNAIRLLMP